MTDAFPRRRVLVTGASSGVGLAIARHLLSRGYEVWGTSRDPGRLASIEGLRPVALDLGERRSIRDAAATILAAGGVDVLVNNAGSGWFGPLEHADESVLDRQFQVLAFGPAQLIRALLPDLRRRRGLVINVTSLAGSLPIPFMGPYSAAKAAMSALTDVWQMELPRDEVGFLDLQPGDLRTAFNDTLDAERWGGDARYGARAGRAWRVMDDAVQKGPPPDAVARVVEQWIRKGGHGRAHVGDPLWVGLGHLAARVLPRSMLQAVLRRYYDIV